MEQSDNVVGRLDGALPYESEALQTLIQQIPAAAYVCEAPGGVIRLYNRQAVTLWGCEPRPGDSEARFCGSLRLYRVVDGSPLPHAESPMAEALRTGIGARDAEVFIERPDGSRVHALVNIAVLRSGADIVGAINVLQDITERRRVEEALRKSEAELAELLVRERAARVAAEAGHEAGRRLAAIVEGSDDAIVGKTLTGIITSWNPGAERMFGYTEAEAVGQPITLIIPPERLGEEKEVLERLRRGERIDHYETVRVRKNGERLDISLTVSPIRNVAGEITGASKIARDITERQRIERERAGLLAREQAARAEAVAANLAKDEFLAMLGHELRNPLAPILAAARLLRQGPMPEERLQRVADITERQVRHLARLLDDLLDVSRIRLGKISLRREPVDLVAIVREALETTRSLLEQRHHRVAATLPGQAVPVLGDRTRLLQIVSNLIDNAAKYTPPGGNVAVALEGREGEAVISVRDSGMGIDRELLPRVFDVFVQGDATLARSHGGLGIGLALVKSLVELHGGRVQALSEGRGQGAEFIVRLPIAEADHQPSPAAPAGARRRALQILVIEDNADSREMLRLALEIEGHRVGVADTGEDGLRRAFEMAPDLVVLDIGLPDVDGYEVARRLREKLGPTFRLIALTGYGQPEDRRRAREAGFDGHLVKPIDPDELLRAVQAREPTGGTLR